MLKQMLLLAVFLCIAGCTIPKQGHIYGEENLPQVINSTDYVKDPYPFFARFFAAPQPLRIASALQRIQENGDFDNDEKAIYISGFLIGALQKYPDKLSTLERRCSRFIMGSGRDLLAYSLWCANTPESYAQLKQIATYTPNAAAHFVGKKAPKFLPETIENSFDLNLYWGLFHATGDLKYLSVIMECLNEDVYRKNTNSDKNYVSNVALETITYNAILDPFVLNYIKKYAEQAPNAYQYDLEKVIRYADQYLIEIERSRQDPTYKLPELFNNNTVGGSPIVIF